MTFLKPLLQHYGYLQFSVAMAIADVFSKNGYTVPNKIAKILRIFDGLETLKSQWVISLHQEIGSAVLELYMHL